MAIYYIYIFDKNGSLLFYNEWSRKKQTGMSREEEGKLMYGMIYSLKSFILKVSPIDLKEGYFSFCTNKYRLHFYETATKVKFVLATDLMADGIRELIHQIFTQVYVDYVVLNPMCALNKPIKSELFATKLDEVIKQSSAYTSRIT